MSVPTVVLLVKFKSKLSLDEIRRVMESRIDQFRALPGLKQKYYLLDSKTGELAGLYLWESPEALAEYRHSELSKTIAAAYEAEGEPRIEAYQILTTLREPAAG
jgi:quinol monooxygenase YgiN